MLYVRYVLYAHTLCSAAACPSPKCMNQLPVLCCLQNTTAHHLSTDSPQHTTPTIYTVAGWSECSWQEATNAHLSIAVQAPLD